MADLGNWFRFVPRARTPVTPRSPVSSERFSFHDAEEQQRSRPGPAHMSSFLSLATHASSQSPEPQEPKSASFSIKDHDKVYNPSLDQLVEALQVNIMANGILAPLPVHMNTYVLRLIEGYSNCQEDLRAKNAALEEVKRMREAAFEDFTVLAEELRNREGQYKSEIRRLEVLLAQKNGLETVTLARTNSTLDRSQPDAKKFVSRLQERRNEAAARDAEARAAASQPTFSFLQGQSLSTDAEIMRVLDQGRGVEGIGIGDGKTSAKYISDILDNESDVNISEKFRRSDAARADAPRRKPRYRAGYAALEPGHTNRRYLRTHSTEKLQPGTGSLTSSSGPTSGAIPAATEAQGAPDGKPSAKTSARIDGNDSDDSSPSQRADSNQSFRLSPSRRNGDTALETKNDRRRNVARESRFSFAEGEDTFTTGTVDAGTFQPSENENGSASSAGSAKGRDDRLVTGTAPRTYEQVRQSQATPTQVPEASPPSARRSTSLHSKGSTSGVKAAPRPPRPYLEGRPLTWSRSPKGLPSTPTGAAAEDVFAGIRSHDSTGSFNTVIRVNSARSNQSVSSPSLAGDSDRDQGSPSQQQRKPGSQRRTSAQIAASRAVARDQTQQSGQI
ncbi:hypothetical protein PG995_013511 [Apiospora arundinis]